MTQLESYGFYFLKSKYDVLDAFKKWKAMVENEMNLKVKCLKSDNERERERESTLMMISRDIMLRMRSR